jgi:hypothetical protein
LGAKHARDERWPIASRYANKRLAQPCLRCPIRHERSTFSLRLQTARPVLAIDKTEIAKSLRFQEPGIEFRD